MPRINGLSRGICMAMVCVSLASASWAGVIATGDVDPGDPTTWTGSTEAYVGKTGEGSVTVDSGSGIQSHNGYIGYGFGSTGAFTVYGSGSTWTNGGLTVGGEGNGTLNITDGGVVNSHDVDYIGHSSGSTGTVTVDGPGSTWTDLDGLYVGYYGNGTLNITNGGAVRNEYCNGYIGSSSGSTGTVTVDGPGSTWTDYDGLYVGYYGNGTLDIINGGLVSVGNTLTIDEYSLGGSFINVASGGMLALLGEADTSLADFMDLIEGTDAIRYWDGADWSPITNGVRDVDYTLGYIQDGGDLDGYTMLTVPEPASMALLTLGGLALLKRRRR